MKYPCLMQSTTSDVIVAFTAEKTGVVVAGKYYPVGHSATDWIDVNCTDVWKPVEPKESVFVPKLMKSVYGGVVWLFTAPTEGICVKSEYTFNTGTSLKNLDHINSGNWKEVEVVQKPEEIKYPCYMQYIGGEVALFTNVTSGVWINGKEIGSVTSTPANSSWWKPIDINLNEVV